MTELTGYAAAAAVLATFLMQSMMRLRLVAILSILMFISYGYLAHIHPVLALHAALLPINAARLLTHQDCRILERAQLQRTVASAASATRHLTVFILGVIAGSLGLTAVAHVVFLIFNLYQHALP